MKKYIIITIAALFSSVAGRAHERVENGDSLRLEPVTLSPMELAPLAPRYGEGVIVKSPLRGNWFVNISGGASAFLGSPLGCSDLFGRITPVVQGHVGKWFTPWIGARLGYQGYQLKDCLLSERQYHYFGSEILLNVLGSKDASESSGYWKLSPVLGLGMMYNTGANKPIAVSYGLQAEYRIAKRLGLSMELSNISTFDTFDGYYLKGSWGDHLPALTVGLTFTIGKTGWKRPMDPLPYIRQNERLVAYANYLKEENHKYVSRHEVDRRTLGELRKVLEIEGLLQLYGHLFDKDADVALKRPKNDYSGLNSLRARIRQRGKGADDVLAQGTKESEAVITDSSTVVKNIEDALEELLGNAREDDAYIVQSDEAADTVGVVTGDGDDAVTTIDMDMTADTDSGADVATMFAEYVSVMQTGKTCIGAPIYFFFNLGTATLTDPSQSVNLEILARIAKEYGLAVKVCGAADSATGSEELNSTLSMSRADFIATQLKAYGVPDNDISLISKGGVADFATNEANRNTMVMLYFK